MRGEGMLSLLSYSRTFRSEIVSKMTSSQRATVRLFGNISKSKDGKRVGEEQVDAPATLRNIIDKLQERLEIPLHREEILILVNGVEANSIDDLDTRIQTGDLIDVLPIYHGGS
jgi:molybdopterin converting factor small subunit